MCTELREEETQKGGSQSRCKPDRYGRLALMLETTETEEGSDEGVV